MLNHLKKSGKIYIFSFLFILVIIISTLNAFNFTEVRQAYMSIRNNFLVFMPKLHYIDALLNEVNFRALFKSNQFDPNSQYSINLNLSLKDIESLKYTFDQSKIANFINDLDYTHT